MFSSRCLNGRWDSKGCPADCPYEGCEIRLNSREQSQNQISLNYTKGYLVVDPFVKIPPKVISLRVSLDLAKIFVDALKTQGFEGHAQVLDTWVMKVAHLKETKIRSVTTVYDTKEVK